MRLLRLILATRRTVPRAFALMRHQGVPMWLKGAAIAAGVLIVSPLDPLADIPIVGLFDDVALLALLANGFVTLADRMLLKSVSPVGPTMRAQPAGVPALRP
ncbi:MAG: hypothetical protein GIW95_12690 [Candidatus Eremiobacteraeota bacterium]|nr:hypothetical protein [Candidatus Eremiobacteraeota bacterium]